MIFNGLHPLSAAKERILKLQTSLRGFLFTYTAFFVVTAPLVFWTFWRHGFSLIHMGDGWTQHSRALAYYGMWLRELISAWIHGNFTFPTFSLSFGYGSDLLTTLQYYGVGDPLNLLAVFVPVKYSELLFVALIILRCYLAGLFFLLTMRYIQKTQNLGMILAAISYSFSIWGLFSAGFHSFFMLPLVLFPLVIWSLERLLREGEFIFFSIVVALSAIANFYFFYMIVLLTVIYVVVRLTAIAFTHGFFTSMRKFGLVCMASVSGVLLAAFALVPVVLAFLTSSRVAAPFTVPTFYNRDYYELLSLQPLFGNPSPGSYVLIYTGPLMLLSLLWLFHRISGRVQEKIFVLLSVVFLIFPWFGHVFNGMNYPNNRWSWVISFLVGYLICVFWEEVWQADIQELRRLFLLVVGYAIFIALLLYHRNDFFLKYIIFSSLFLVLVVLVVIFFGRLHVANTLPKVTVAIFTVVSIVVSGHAYYLSHLQVPTFSRSNDWSQNYKNNDAAVISRLSDEKLTRYERTLVHSIPDSQAYADSTNNSILHGVSSTQFFWSLDQSASLKFFEDLALGDFLSYQRVGLDGRSILNYLIGAEYHSTGSDFAPPYGYELQGEYSTFYPDGSRDINVYANNNVLPVAYSYDLVLDNNEWEKFSASQREEAMLHGVKIEEKIDSPSQRSVESLLKTRKLNASIKTPENVAVKNGSFVATQEKQSVDIIFDEVTSGEVHVDIKGLDTDSSQIGAPITANFWCDGRSLGVPSFYYVTKNFTWYQDRHDFVLNSRYCDSSMSGVTLTFDKPGTYTFDDIEVWYQPLENIEEPVKKLEAEKLERIDFHDIGLSRATNRITGDITVSEPKVLVVTIPKTDGWTAYVDGKEQEILTANIMFMGLELEPGHHDIRFVYHTPGLRLGFAISVVTLVGICAVWVFQRKRRMSSSRDSEAEE